MLLLFNADHVNTIAFVLPPPENGLPWELLLDTACDELAPPRAVEKSFKLAPCSAATFRSNAKKETPA